MTGTPGSCAPERRDHRVDQVAVERHLEADVADDDLDLDVVADDPLDVGERVVLGARKHAHVDERLGDDRGSRCACSRR